MALSRSRMAAAKRIQSRRRVRFCLFDNEQQGQSEVRWKEILLESKDTTNNKDSKTEKET